MMRIVLILILLSGLETQVIAQNADINLLKSININRSKSLDGTMETLSNTYLGISLAVPVAEFIYGYTKHSAKNYRHAIQTVGGLGACAAFTVICKYSLQRDRPYVTYPNILDVYQQSPNDPSFPSGHAAIAFSTATSLSLCYKSWYVTVPSYLWATGVAYSQLHLGMHYPTDVLFGAIIGAGSSWLSMKTTRFIRSRRQELYLLK